MKLRSNLFTVVATMMIVVLVVGPAGAVLKVQDGSLVVQDDNGQPMPQAKISISFNGVSQETDTDDDGGVPLVLVGESQMVSDDDRDKGVVLVGDGKGRIYYPGGPEDGEGTVKLRHSGPIRPQDVGNSARSSPII